MQEIWTRRQETEKRIKSLRSWLPKAEVELTSKACVYVTGSFGRCEASPHSDLDLFIVGLDSKDIDESLKSGKHSYKSRLQRLEEICLKADLIRATRHCNIQEFSGDGEYLTHYSVSKLTTSIGAATDDALNTFTARLLLLLESKPLLGQEVYKEIISTVVQAYFRDYDGHEKEFVPAFLTNDILRLWRTFCVNYEARTQSEPLEKKLKRRVRNYKLRHSRLLTCYSAILYLLCKMRISATISPDDISSMSAATPVERLAIAQELFPRIKPEIEKIYSLYAKFLQTTNRSEADLLALFHDRERAKSYAEDAVAFGDAIAGVLLACSGEAGREYFRLLLV